MGNSIKFIGIIILGLWSCQKIEPRYNDAKLSFSIDTLQFDTVFQSLGSATKMFTIYNHSNREIIIDSAYLSKPNSKFRVNIDGVLISEVKGLVIPARDSILAFVEVKINPQTGDLLETDFIVFSLQKNYQTLVLQALGRDCYLHRGEIINGNEVWKSDKPHVILGLRSNNGLTPGVVINGNLTINQGANLYFDASAGLLVSGKLQSLGTSENPIIMQGIRLETNFQNATGQWLGLLFYRNSRGNELNNTRITESSFGIWAGFQDSVDYAQMSDATRPELTLRQCKIDNAHFFALRSFNAEITAENCIFFTSTDYLVQLILGGKYSFLHCTFMNIQSQENKGVLLLTNSYIDRATRNKYVNKIESTLIENSILYSSASESITFVLDESLNQDNVTMSHCNYNSTSSWSNDFITNSQLNMNPRFVSIGIDKEDLKLQANSPCINAGRPSRILIDFLGNQRNNADIGAYKF
ncbi:MAG: hypothetical protein MUE53_04300 [Chitinophagales bacterium]|nr:hypothetical protein [Chitinophagales bacterium]